MRAVKEGVFMLLFSNEPPGLTADNRQQMYHVLYHVRISDTI